MGRRDRTKHPPTAGGHIMSTTGRRDSVTADDGTGNYIMSRRGKANDYSDKRRCKYSVLLSFDDKTKSQCTDSYVCPVAPTTKVSLIGNNYCPVVRPVASLGQGYGRQLLEDASPCPVVVPLSRRPVCF